MFSLFKKKTQYRVATASDFKPSARIKEVGSSRIMTIKERFDDTDDVWICTTNNGDALAFASCDDNYLVA